MPLQKQTRCVAKPSVSPPDAQPRRILPQVDFDHCTIQFQRNRAMRG